MHYYKKISTCCAVNCSNNNTKGSRINEIKHWKVKHSEASHKRNIQNYGNSEYLKSEDGKKYGGQCSYDQTLIKV